MHTNQRDYQSYLLRIWRVGAKDKRQWRLTLEDTLSGELRGFNDLEQLVEYLRLRNSLEQELTEGPKCPGEE